MELGGRRAGTKRRQSQKKKQKKGGGRWRCAKRQANELDETDDISVPVTGIRSDIGHHNEWQSSVTISCQA